MRQTKTFLYALLALASIPALTFAHGSMENPVSRVFNCFQEGPENLKSAACIKAEQIGGKQPMYDWMEVNQANGNDNHQLVVPDGTLCAGGKDKYRGFNEVRNDWTTTNITPDENGNFEFSYYGHAPHPTKYFKFYVTKNGWDKSKPLRWSDLEEFARVDGIQYPLPALVKDIPKMTNAGHYYMNVKLPANKTGQHIIYNVWQRPNMGVDSEEAFYSCSDVNFVGGKTQTNSIFNSPWK